MGPIDPNTVSMSVQSVAPPSSAAASSNPAAASPTPAAHKPIPECDATTDFPDNDSPTGNTLQCLENTLVDIYVDQFAEPGFDPSKPSDQTKAVEFMQTRITKLRGKPLKHGDRADSPIIADVHTLTVQTKRLESKSEANQRVKQMEARGETVNLEDHKQQQIPTGDPRTTEVYKFHTTWEIDYTDKDGNPQTIKKTQWIITGVEIPQDLGDTDTFEQTKHMALLALKAHRHIHKAAIDPGHNDYEKVKECIQDLKCHDIVGYSGMISENRMQFIAVPISTGEEEMNPAPQTIDARQHVQTTTVNLKNSRGKKVKLHIDHSYTARKLDEQGKKWLKAMPTVGISTHGQKLYNQAQEMDIRIPTPGHRLARHENLLGAQSVKDVFEALGLDTAPGEDLTLAQSSSARVQDRDLVNKISDARSASKEKLNDVQDNFDRENKQLKALVLAKSSTGFLDSINPFRSRSNAMEKLRSSNSDFLPEILTRIDNLKQLQNELNNADETHKNLKLAFQLIANQNTFKGGDLEFQNAYAREHSGIGSTSRAVTSRQKTLDKYR